jgi:hypothetical protein
MRTQNVLEIVWPKQIVFIWWSEWLAQALAYDWKSAFHRSLHFVYCGCVLVDPKPSAEGHHWHTGSDWGKQEYAPEGGDACWAHSSNALLTRARCSAVPNSLDNEDNCE